MWCLIVSIPVFSPLSYFYEEVNFTKLTLEIKNSIDNTISINAFYWYQMFALDSAVVEVQEIFSLHVSYLCKNGIIFM